MTLTSQKITAAIKRAECFEVDYSGMTEEEINELDYAIDTVFAAAKEYAKILQKYRELKVIEAKDI